MEFLRGLDWGSVPAWFGAASLILAFWIFMRDRRVAERAQVEQLGVWAEVERQPQGDEVGRFFLIAKNASVLPLRVVEVLYASTPQWGKSGSVEELSGFADVQHVRVGDRRRLDRFRFGVIPPDAERRAEQLPNFSEQRPAESGWKLASIVPMTVTLQRILVVDNANRRWVVSPNRAGHAQRLRWYSLFRERIGNRLHPWSTDGHAFVGYWFRYGWKGFKSSNWRGQYWRFDRYWRDSE